MAGDEGAVSIETLCRKNLLWIDAWEVDELYFLEFAASRNFV